ncbi:MAG TPA: hypothetical protein VFL17_07950 [Anaerolineae bacterium]|nr:hypothetical protein [Anaerolineae bacterium]
MSVASRIVTAGGTPSPSSPSLLIDEPNAEEGDMELVLVLMLGFLLLCARSNGQKRADVGVVEVVLAAAVLMLLLGQVAA